MGTKTPKIVLENRGLTKRLSLLGIPVDLVPQENLDQVIAGLLQEKGSHQVVFLRTPDFMRALRNPEYKACLQKAALVIPVSKSLQAASLALGVPGLVRYAPFDFVVRILNVLDQKSGGFYLLGDKSQGLAVTEKNLKWTFPKSQALGRFHGFFGPAMEKNIRTAISKAIPNFFLLGPGPKGGDLWISRRASTFQRGIQVCSRECFNYFSLRQKRPNKVSFAKGRDFYHEIRLNPWKAFLFPIHLMFNLTVLYLRLSKRGPITPING